MNPPPQNPSRRWANVVIICLFLGVLWLPTVDYFSGLDHTPPPGENRLPAPKPRLVRRDLSGVQAWLATAEIYFNDHFGFRKRLIRWFQQWKVRLYHDASVNKAVPGEAGWLFTGEEQMVDHFLGRARFTPAQLQAWQALLEKRRNWLAQRGIKYLFVIPPDKQTIYPEFLPAWLRNAAPTNRETKLDQFLIFMKEHSTVAILDLRPPLIAAKTSAPTYLKNDTHWNLFGGFVACQAVIKTLAEQFPDLPPLRTEEYRWSNAPATGGDLARILGSAEPEQNFFTFRPDPSLPLLQTQENPAFKSNWGIKTVFTVDNPSAAVRRKVVVFHDSFGEAWRPFLARSFQRAVFELDNREFCPELIVSNAPDVVINEILERFVNTMDPGELLAKDALP